MNECFETKKKFLTKVCKRPTLLEKMAKSLNIVC